MYCLFIYLFLSILQWSQCSFQFSPQPPRGRWVDETIEMFVLLICTQYDQPGWNWCSFHDAFKVRNRKKQANVEYKKNVTSVWSGCANLCVLRFPQWHMQYVYFKFSVWFLENDYNGSKLRFLRKTWRHRDRCPVTIATRRYAETCRCQFFSFWRRYSLLTDFIDTSISKVQVGSLNFEEAAGTVANRRLTLREVSVSKMPLLVTDYSWTQTDSAVYISVPLKGCKAEKVDILSTDEYLKVNHHATDLHVTLEMHEQQDRVFQHV